MTARLLNLVTIAVVIFTMLPAMAPVPALAGDGAVRVNIAGRQRMLSQTIAKALCTVTLTGDEAYAGQARFAMQLFDSSLRALKHGETMGIMTAETDPQVLDAIGEVWEIWFHLGPNFWLVSRHNTDSLLAAELIDDNLLLLQRSQTLVTEIERNYRTKGIKLSKLRTVNQSGRMRMLSEKLMKDACFLLEGYRTEEIRADLTTTINQIELGLSDLENGNALELIEPPPNDAVTQELATMRQTWTKILEELQPILVGAEVAPEAFLGIADLGQVFVLAANAATHAYSDEYTPNQ